MLDVSPEDIAALPDAVLRELVGKLCEATVRAKGFSAAGVTWGGDQDAGDGGIDVRVQVQGNISGFIPAASTGFQVKKPAMRRAEILREMKPNGVLRPSIQQLVDAGGAYVIACSAASVSDSALEQRRAAMRSAVAGERNGELLTLDFYDTRRLATWLQDHPGLIPWAREKAGRPIQGWKSYGHWSVMPESGDAAYLTDDQIRLRIRSDANDQLTAIKGLEYIRGILSKPRKSVRLVGLSGVGKTRFAQALFEEIGDNPLDPGAVIYADTADSLTPAPTALISDLIARNLRAIVVLDNCPADTHRRMTDLCRAANSLISILTIEYDIRDDEPEGSEAVKLEASSPKLIKKLLLAHIPGISASNAEAIADSDISGGNARIALALARSLRPGDSISSLNDATLFQRLFKQRNDPDHHLLRSAEACALVYSFDVETQAGTQAELPLLAQLINLPQEEVFRYVANLKSRDLVQQRGRWRAVLPHAIANRLAKAALQSIPNRTIEAQLIERAPDRLARSFSRRLGYLNNCPEAISLAERWLAPDGFLADITKLNELGLAMLSNVTPIAQESTLAAVERYVANPPIPTYPAEGITARRKAQNLALQLAYEPTLFERCCRVLARLTDLEEPSEHNNDNVWTVSRTLFQARASYTHATVSQRLKIVSEFTRAADPKRRIFGESLLLSMLKTSGFQPHLVSDFGMTTRDYGYQPATREEIEQWFSQAIDAAIALFNSAPESRPRLRREIAPLLRGLCVHAQVYASVNLLVNAFLASGYWPEAWLSIRYALRIDKGKPDRRDQIEKQLSNLLDRLQPENLVDRVRSVIFSGHGNPIDIADLEADANDNYLSAANRVGKAAEELGRAVADDEEAFADLLPQLVTLDGTYLPSFGRGLALGSENPEKLLCAFQDALSNVDRKEGNVRTLLGVLGGLQENHSEHLESFMECAVEDPIWGYYFPILQSSLSLTNSAIARLRRSLTAGIAPLWQYRNLQYGSATDKANPPDLAQFLNELAKADGGRNYAIDILAMHFYLDSCAKRPHHEALIETGRVLLRGLQFDADEKNNDHDIGRIAAICLSAKNQRALARVILTSYMKASASRYVSSSEFHDTLSAIFKAQPIPSLDVCLLGKGRRRHAWDLSFDDDDGKRNVLSEVPTETIVRWAKRFPAKRFPLAAASVPFCIKIDEGRKSTWTEVALALVAAAPDKEAVLRNFIERFKPNAWSGSRADIIARRAEALLALDPDNAIGLRDVALRAFEELQGEISKERAWEARRERERDETFE